MQWAYLLSFRDERKDEAWVHGTVSAEDVVTAVEAAKAEQSEYVRDRMINVEAFFACDRRDWRG